MILFYPVQAAADPDLVSTTQALSNAMKENALGAFQSMIGFLGIFLGIIIVFALLYNLFGFNK